MARKIVILDDLDEQKTFLSRFLGEANYEVVLTERELDLLDIVNLQSPNLIMINSGLRDYDTYLICKKIKLLEKGENIPVIFIKRDDRYFDAEAMFNAGGSDYISYPFSTAEILHKVAQQMQIVDLKNQLAEKTEQLNKLIPHYQKLTEVLEKARQEITKLKLRSSSKLLNNQQEFEAILAKEWLRSARQRADLSDLSGTSISLIFTEINDFYFYQKNHQSAVVDNCLNFIKEKLHQTAKRPGDIIAQLRIDKFAILLPNTNTEGAKRVAEIINENVRELQIPHHYSEISEFISLSFGIATAIPSQAIPVSDLIETADKALHNALEMKQENAIVTDSF